MPVIVADIHPLKLFSGHSGGILVSFQPEQLKPFAKKYVWWKTPEDAIRYPRRVVAQVMNIGDWKDVIALERMVGADYLREVIANAEIGQFNARSWHFWHYRLGMAEIGHVPPMPVRRTG